MADSIAMHGYGRRYVLSELDQTTFGVETRLSVTFTPQLLLELYAQPFLSIGNFRGLKELSAPCTLEFARYGSGIGILGRDTLGIYVIDLAINSRYPLAERTHKSCATLPRAVSVG